LRLKKVFGLTPVSEDKANRILRLGTGGAGVNSTLVSLRQQSPAGDIDHFALTVKGFNRDAVTEVLKSKKAPRLTAREATNRS
jgi:hypothetical protein